MTYKEVPNKQKDAHQLNKLGKKSTLSDMQTLSTSSILWFVLKRHKTGLFATWAIVITAVYIFPPLPDMVLSVVR